MTNEHFCQNVLALLGESYAECDCIGVIRKAAGIRCAGTNWLWRSYKSSGKYRYLTERMERSPIASELKNGLLVFRIKWDQIPNGYSDKPNCHHVGVIIGSDVIQSQSGRGVYRKRYDYNEWDGCGWLKQVDKPMITNPSHEPEYDQDYDEDFDDYETLEPPTYELTDHEMLLALYNRFIID